MRQPMRIAPYCVLALLALGTVFQVRAGAQAETSQRPITEIEGKSLDQWIKDLKNPDPATKVNAIDAILYVLKYDPSAQVRQEAAMALGELGRPATLPEYQKEKSYLLQALHDPEKTVVIWSYVAMLVIDSTVTEEHLVAIAGLLKPKGNKPIVRLHATRALAALGKKAKSRVPNLIEALKDSEPQAATSAAFALGKMGTISSKHLREIADLLKDPEWQTRMEAVRALGCIGSSAKEMIPDIVEAF